MDVKKDSCGFLRTCRSCRQSCCCICFTWVSVVKRRKAKGEMCWWELVVWVPVGTDLVGMEGAIDSFGWQGREKNVHFPGAPCWQVLNDCFSPLPAIVEEQFLFTFCWHLVFELPIETSYLCGFGRFFNFFFPTPLLCWVMLSHYLHSFPNSAGCGQGNNQV